MKSYYGKCACGNAEYSITLPQDLSCYTPRACDCDFCTSRKVEYLSDPAGRIEIRSVLPLQRLKQGSNQATFLSCPTCATILGVAYITDKVSVGAVNATCLVDKAALQPAISASPKQLTAEEKVARWLMLWSSLKITEHG